MTPPRDPPPLRSRIPPTPPPRAISPNEVLDGLLVLTCFPDGQPSLEVKALCRHCDRAHVHPWPDPPFERNLTQRSPAACKGGPYRQAGAYTVRLSGCFAEENAETVDDAIAAIGCWHKS